MSAHLFKSSVAAVAAALLGLVAVPAAQAGSQALVGYDASGNVINSGWTASWSSAYDGNIALTFRGMSSTGQFFFEKDATLTAPAGNGIDGIEISFVKTSATASPLVINDEVIRNKTGTDWDAFQWILASSNNSSGNPSFAFTTSDGSSGIGDFRISPFTTFTFSNSGSVLSFSGGTVANGSTWFAGANSSTGIAIVANGTTDNFVLKEVPIGVGAGPGPAIPLPAAAWTGMSTLLGLGLLAAAKNARKLLA